jgi:hypothetical protein
LNAVLYTLIENFALFSFSLLLFQFALPAIQVILFCLCIGADPFNISVAIVNEEDPPFLSKIFLEKIDPHLVHQVCIN